MKKINFKSSIEQGLLGFIDTAFPIFLINLTGGFFLALKAWFYQGIATFFTVVINTTIFQYLYLRNHKIIAIIIPTLISTSLSYYAHLIGNSPEKLYSVLFILLTSLWYFSLLAYLQEKFKTIGVIDLFKIFIKWIKTNL